MQSGLFTAHDAPTSSRFVSTTMYVLPQIFFLPMTVERRCIALENTGVPSSVTSMTSPFGKHLYISVHIVSIYVSCVGMCPLNCILNGFVIFPYLLPPMSMIFAPSSFACFAISLTRMEKSSSPRAWLTWQWTQLISILPPLRSLSLV